MSLERLSWIRLRRRGSRLLTCILRCQVRVIVCFHVTKSLAKTGFFLVTTKGKYDGTNAIGRAFEDFKAGKLEDNKTGIMVHYVIAQVDRGAPILVKEIECREGEELEQLEQRIHSHEHELIVEAAAKVAGEILDKKDKTQ